MCQASSAGLALLLCLPVSAAQSQADPARVDTGRHIYEDGVLPDGSGLRALRPEGFELEGSHAACATCHRHSGMGSVEGSIDSTVLVPPVAGSVLFVPGRFETTYLDDEHHYVPTEAWWRTMKRPAYDRQTLARALRSGLDPAGRSLLSPMPRYDLDDKSLEALTAYLRQLTSAPDPGVEAGILHVATVVAPGARPGQADAMLGVLRTWSRSAHTTGKSWRLHVWALSGAPADWSAQLESHYRRQPVFALLSGIGGVEWEPVQEFCEQQRLACVLPSLEVIPEVGDDHYSMYFSPGVALEARVLARHLHDQRSAQGDEGRVVQVYGDATGRHAANLLTALPGMSESQVSKRSYRFTAPRTAVDGLAENDSLVLWLRAEAVNQMVTAMPEGPKAGHIYLSALLAEPGMLDLPAAWKMRVRYVSLFDDLGLQGEIARLRLERWLEGAGLADNPERRVQADTYAACYLFDDALADIHQQEVRRPAAPLTREQVLETLEDHVNKYNDSTGLVDPDGHVAYYGRMSLGPDQRVAVHGGTILRYASPDSGRLVADSPRIVP